MIENAHKCLPGLIIKNSIVCLIVVFIDVIFVGKWKIQSNRVANTIIISIWKPKRANENDMKGKIECCMKISYLQTNEMVDAYPIFIMEYFPLFFSYHCF